MRPAERIIFEVRPDADGTVAHLSCGHVVRVTDYRQFAGATALCATCSDDLKRRDDTIRQAAVCTAFLRAFGLRS